MAYATVTDVQNAMDASTLKKLTDDTGIGATFVSGIVLAGLDFGAGMMAANLWRAPNAANDDVKYVNVVLCKSYLYNRRDGALPQPVAQEVQQVMVILDAWRNGTAYPSGAAPLPTSSNQSGQTVINIYDKNNTIGDYENYP